MTSCTDFGCGCSASRPSSATCAMRVGSSGSIPPPTTHGDRQPMCCRCVTSQLITVGTSSWPAKLPAPYWSTFLSSYSVFFALSEAAGCCLEGDLKPSHDDDPYQGHDRHDERALSRCAS